MSKECTKVCLAKKYGKNQDGFFMLQVLPALLATVTVVVTLVACYGRCVQTMFRHNRILAAQTAGERYYFEREEDILFKAGVVCQELVRPVDNAARLHELQLYDRESGRLLVNIFHVESDER